MRPFLEEKSTLKHTAILFLTANSQDLKKVDSMKKKKSGNSKLKQNSYRNSEVHGEQVTPSTCAFADCQVGKGRGNSCNWADTPGKAMLPAGVPDPGAHVRTQHQQHRPAERARRPRPRPLPPPPPPGPGSPGARVHSTCPNPSPNPTSPRPAGLAAAPRRPGR